MLTAKRESNKGESFNRKTKLGYSRVLNDDFHNTTAGIGYLKTWIRMLNIENEGKYEPLIKVKYDLATCCCHCT